MITSPSHAIELLGGPKAVADLTNRPFTTVASWASRQSIPVDAWSGLIDLANEKQVEGFTYEALAKAHAKPVAEPPKADGERSAA